MLWLGKKMRHKQRLQKEMNDIKTGIEILQNRLSILEWENKHIEGWRMNKIIIDGKGKESLAEFISELIYCVDSETKDNQIILKII